MCFTTKITETLLFSLESKNSPPPSPENLENLSDGVHFSWSHWENGWTTPGLETRSVSKSEKDKSTTICAFYDWKRLPISSEDWFHLSRLQPPIVFFPYTPVVGCSLRVDCIQHQRKYGWSSGRQGCEEELRRSGDKVLRALWLFPSQNLLQPQMAGG